MKKPSQCHEKHWTSKLWHMGQDLLHSSSVAHVQIRGIFLMQMAIGTCIHCLWFIRNKQWLWFGLVNVCSLSTQIIGIFLPKLFWPIVRKNCSSDGEKLLKFEAEGRKFAKVLRSVEQFIQTVNGQNNFW